MDDGFIDGIEVTQFLVTASGGDLSAPFSIISNDLFFVYEPMVLFSFHAVDDSGAYAFTDDIFMEVDAGLDFVEEWVVSEKPPPAVPVPAAAWLFGSALLGLFGVARRKKAQRI